MKKGLLLLLLLAVLVPAAAQEKSGHARPSRRGESAGYGSRDATILSMMGWGVGIGAAIATLCALIPNNSGSTNSGSTSH